MNRASLNSSTARIALTGALIVLSGCAAGP